MNDTTCIIDGCDKERATHRRMCVTHYRRKYLYGDPLWTAEPKYPDLVGHIYGELTVIERDGLHWICQCTCGTQTRVKTRDLNSGNTSTCGDGRIHWRGDQPTYKDIHHRVQADHGSAGRYTCVDCGARAHHWSYDNRDSTSEHVSQEGFLYSYDLNHYQPRCRHCHKELDIAERRRRGMDRTGPYSSESRVGH